MLIEHAGKRPTIDTAAWVAPDATLCGDVTIGPGVRILHGARLVGEAGGVIRIGHHGIIMKMP
jgi:carbonic anhydrase/acetyltransferase-like protein (isoleucine patch superfamily)